MPSPHRVRRHVLQPFVIMPLVAVLGVGAWWFTIRSDDAASTPATATSSEQLVTVTRGAMNSTVSAEGTVAAASTDDLSFTGAGTVTAVNVQAGDTVKAGQVLATIDSTELRATLAAAEATLATAKATLADDQAASASTERLTADLLGVSTADDSLTAANQALAGAQLVSTIDGTVASVDLTVGEVLGTSGTGGVNLTGSGTGSGRSSSTLGQGGGGNSPLGANSSTTSTNAGTGSSTPQIQVVSSGSFKVDLAVNASDIAKVAVGQPATVTVTTSSAGRAGGFGRGGFGGFGGSAIGGAGAAGGASSSGTTANRQGTNTNGATNAGTAGGASATGTVTAVSRVATASSGVATFTVTVSFQDTSNRIFVGSTVTGEIVTASRPDVVQVPARAVTTDDSGSSVRLAVDGTTTGKIETRTVTTGTTLNGQTEISSGLQPGDQVVITLPGFPGGLPGTNSTGGGFTGTGGSDASNGPGATNSATRQAAGNP